ncbi:MAG TPA: DNA repair protein RecN [Caulobacteraceae bacterium]|jgi:DNA repair protein RecN (Recombination protein N)|nr:DNA repair protein RecN [Caulobacteraceae bacterium]
MLIGLAIRDVVLIEALDLAPGPGLTALTGETGAGKSIILDSLGLALGARAETALIRRGASQAVVTAIFAPSPDGPVWDCLDEKGLAYDRTEDLVLRRIVTSDGRSRAFVNDQPAGVGVLKELGALLVEVHGQHQTVGLLDSRNHAPMLDRVGGCEPLRNTCRSAWNVWRDAAARAGQLEAEGRRTASEVEALSEQLADLDRLAPQPDEIESLAEQRAVMGASEKVLADVAQARNQLAFDDLSSRLGSAVRGLERARARIASTGAGEEGALYRLLAAAVDCVDRALVETGEAASAIDAAAEALQFDPEALERTEERLFALRAAARRLGVEPETLHDERVRIAARVSGLDGLGAHLAAAQAEAQLARTAYLEAAAELSAARRLAASRLAGAVQSELAPLKLDAARFEVSVEAVSEERIGPTGTDRIEFRIATLPGASPQPLGDIASGGELSRIALALKMALSDGAQAAQPLMIFDEIDQGVGGAVADAIGVRLRALSRHSQVLVVTHSPQVAARADSQWRVRKAGEDRDVRALVDVLSPAAREEEIARMLAGAKVTEAARAAARALMDV